MPKSYIGQNKTINLAIALSVVLIIIGSLLVNSRKNINNDQALKMPDSPDKIADHAPVKVASVVVKPQGYLDNVDPVFRTRLLTLLKEYKDEITLISVQVTLLDVRDYILNFYPSTGQNVFIEAIIKVFPANAKQIVETIKKMDEYNRWLLERGKQLAALSEIESNQKIWEKRTHLFGDDAAQIWDGELTAYEQRKQDARDTFDYIEKTELIGNDEKLYQLKSSMENMYGHTIEDFSVNKNLISSLYLSIDSVQKELMQLPPEQRQQKINEIRRRIGYTDQQIEKMQLRDVKRNNRWENGLSYMEARSKIEKKYADAELDYQLDILRGKYFQHEAKTIAAEEKSGFYRYLRPRVIGKN